jgi:hypothetical protein
MNAVPTQILVFFGDNRFPVEALEEIYAGIRQRAQDIK